jgi:transposase-like protein
VIKSADWSKSNRNPLSIKSSESNFLARSWLRGRMIRVSRRASPELSGEQKVQVVLAVLAGELSLSAAGRRHGVAPATIRVARPVLRGRTPRGLGRSPAWDEAAGVGGGASDATGERAAQTRARRGDRAAADLAQRERSTFLRSLRRPRGSKDRGGDAGLEVRCVGGHPGTDLPLSAGPPYALVSQPRGRGRRRGSMLSRRWPRSTPRRGRPGDTARSPR